MMNRAEITKEIEELESLPYPERSPYMELRVIINNLHQMSELPICSESLRQKALTLVDEIEAPEKKEKK